MGGAQPMRILEVLEPGRDGVFRHVEGLVRFLIRKGCAVDLAYSSVRSSADLHRLVADVTENGGAAIDLKIDNAPGRRDFAAGRQLWELIKTRQPDLVHAHSSKAGALVRLLAPLLRCPVFYTPHAYYSMAAVQMPNARLFRFIERQLGRVGTTINVSEDEARYATQAIKVKPDMQRVIDNPVDEHFFEERTAALVDEARLELGIPRDAVVLGSVGRFTQQKDPETLYRGFALAAAQEPNLVLAHLGEGPLRESMMELARELGIAERVHVFKYRDDSLTFYRAIDALAMSSRYEGCSIAILEALAQGLPVVTTTCPGCANIATANLSHCWTAPVGDPAGFADAIRGWLSDRPAARPSNHVALAMARFSAEVCYGAVLEEYTRKVHARGSQAQFALKSST
jgi:glycosyltransferase involved in cell wall biosynthesis